MDHKTKPNFLLPTREKLKVMVNTGSKIMAGKQSYKQAIALRRSGSCIYIEVENSFKDEEDLSHQNIREAYKGMLRGKR